LSQALGFYVVVQVVQAPSSHVRVIIAKGTNKWAKNKRKTVFLLFLPNESTFGDSQIRLYERRKVLKGADKA
jgi:hypothetical protein